MPWNFVEFLFSEDIRHPVSLHNHDMQTTEKKETPIRVMNNKQEINSNQNSSGTLAKIKAAVLGLTPATVFKISLATSVIVLAASIIYRTATQSIHVNLDKVETTTVVLNGSQDLGGIEAGGYKGVSYGVKNESTKPAYVFVRIEMGTPRLYEVVGASAVGDPDGWCRVVDAEDPGELIYAFTGESGAGGNGGNGGDVEMQPVAIGESVTFAGRLHCLADAERYSQLSSDDMDIDVTGCLVYGIGEDGGSVTYDTSAESLWQAYVENK